MEITCELNIIAMLIIQNNKHVFLNSDGYFETLQLKIFLHYIHWVSLKKTRTNRCKHKLNVTYIQEDIQLFVTENISEHKVCF